jgi:hypothetical protein
MTHKQRRIPRPRRPIFLTVVAAGLVLAGTATFTAAGAREDLPIGGAPVVINATQLPSFEYGKPTRTDFGDLRWIGGLELTSPSGHLGGLSGLLMLDQGARLLAVTDDGHWLDARLDRDISGRPGGLSQARMAPILDSTGQPLKTKRNADAEGLTLHRLAGVPHLLVSFERRHRILALPFAGVLNMRARAQLFAGGRQFERLGLNKGLEALAGGLAAGLDTVPLVAFAERHRDDVSNIPGWILSGLNRGRIMLARRDRFDITDAAYLPDGDLLILERRFNLLDGIGMRLRIVAAADLRPGALLSGQVIMQAGFSHQIDNMEGLAVHLDRRGRIVVTLISDDNRSALQRTLLHQFQYLPSRRPRRQRTTD